jgi:hypothetical protein
VDHFWFTQFRDEVCHQSSGIESHEHPGQAV